MPSDAFPSPGSAHAALVFEGADCVGWCRFGPPGEVPRIKNRAAYEKEGAMPPDWRIACCFVAKGHRRQGVFAAGLAGAIDLIADLGGGRLEGYPEDPGAVPASFLFHRSTVNLRAARLRPRSQDWQAPVGRHQGRAGWVLQFPRSLERCNRQLLPLAATVDVGAVFDSHDSDDVVLIVDGVDDPMIAASRRMETFEAKLQWRAGPVGILGYRPVQELDRGSRHLLGKLGQVTPRRW
jgi:hypothetical protein